MSHPYLSIPTPPVHSIGGLTQNYIMYAQRIMNSDLPSVRPEDSVGRVLNLMDEYKVRHLPLVNGSEFSGLIYEDDLMEVDEQTPMAALEARPVWIGPDCHLYDLVGKWVEAEVDALPVASEGQYLGSVDAPSILKFLAEQTHWATNGAVIVLEVPEHDVSISEIARLVESSDTKVIACTTSQSPESGHVQVTIKVQTEDVEPVVATFQRFGYVVHSLMRAPKLEEELRDRYDAFMRYLKQ
ncbi:MAG: CBS domain-containing protein [Flavobacteriales bacterium]